MAIMPLPFKISRYASAHPGCRRKNLVIGVLHFGNASAVAGYSNYAEACYVANSGIHLHDLAPAQHSSEATSR